MLESLGKSLSNIIDERLSNPLVVSFVLAWSGWNYKFIVLLLSKTPAMQTFDLIADELYPCWQAYVFRGMLFPLLTTLAYIYVLPYFSTFVNDRWRKNQLNDQRNRQQYEDKKLLTEEEAREYRARQRELEGQLDAAQKEGEQQKADLKKADAENRNLLEKAALGIEVEHVRGEFKNLREQLDVVNTSLEHEVQLKRAAEREISRLTRELAEANDRAPGSAQAGFPLVFDAQPAANTLADDVGTDPVSKLAELLKTADDETGSKRNKTRNDGSIRLITENLESNWRDPPSEADYASVAEELWRKSQSSGVDSITHSEIPPGLLMEGLHQIWRLSGDFGHNELIALRTLPPNTESPLAEICNMLEALIPQRDIARLLERLAREKFVYIDEHGHSVIRIGKGNALVQSSNLLAAAYKAASSATP